MTSIQISDITGLSFPYNVYICDVFGNQCILVATILDGVPPAETIYLPPLFNSAPAVGVRIVSHDCERFKIVN